MNRFPALQAQLQAAMFNQASTRTRLDALWQQARCLPFVGQAGVNLCLWHLNINHNAKAALFIVPGRIEASHKYAELCLDACSSGYQVFVLDHRGQGLSDRLCADRQIGLVYQFDHYADDLALAVSAIKQHCTLPLLALAHSMGSAVLYRYLQRQPNHPLQAAIFCAPMFGIPLGNQPKQLRWFSQLMCQLNSLFGNKPWYVPGQQPYQARPFIGNDLTDCPERYQWFRDLYRQYPAYQLGGVSWYWLAAALNACEQIQQQAAPTLPQLIIQAGADNVVDNQAQRLLAHRHQLTLVEIANARHELWAGTDLQRAALIDHINQFLTTLAVVETNDSAADGASDGDSGSA